jgi:hypothetical protein
LFKIDLDRNGDTDLVIDARGALLVVMSFGNRYQLHRMDTGIEESATDLVSIDSVSQLRKLLVKKTSRGVDTLVYRFNGFIEYTHEPDTNISPDSVVWSVYWNGDLAERLKVYRNLSASYTTWPERSGGEVTIMNGIYLRKTYNQLVELLRYMRPHQMTKAYNNGWSHSDHCITDISINGNTVKIDDYGGDGTFGLRQLYTIMHQIRETVKTQQGLR